MRRRTRSLVLVLALAFLAAPLGAAAQVPGTVHRIGWLGPLRWARGAFLSELNRLGWSEGRNLAVEYRWPQEKGQYERLPALAAELVGLEVDLIVSAMTISTRAAAGATTSIPIVFVVVSDPIGDGFVDSFARPGRNITGAANALLDIGGKMVELLTDALPDLAHVAYLWNAAHGQVARELLERKQTAARALGVRLTSFEVRRGDEVEPALAAILREKADALVVLQDPLTFAHQARIVEFARAHRMPTMVNGPKQWAEAGALMSYSPDYAQQFRRAAHLVDKVLRGANPAELPVEAPTEFELVVNLKTAKALGLTIPRSVLVRASEIIE